MLSSKDEGPGWILGFHIAISLTNLIYKWKFKGRQGQFWLEIRAPQRSWYLSLSSVQFSYSVVSDSSRPPWTAARQASLSITSSQSPSKPMSIELVMPSSHLILCRPLLLLPSIFPNIRVFSHESAFLMRWPKYWSSSFSISLSNEHSGMISFRIDWLDLLAVQGTLKFGELGQWVSFSERESCEGRGRPSQAETQGWESRGHVTFSSRSAVEMDETVVSSNYCPPGSRLSTGETLINVPESSFLKDSAKSSSQLRNEGHLVFQESPSCSKNKHSHREQLFMPHCRRFQHESSYIFFCSSSDSGISPQGDGANITWPVRASFHFWREVCTLNSIQVQKYNLDDCSLVHFKPMFCLSWIWNRPHRAAWRDKDRETENVGSNSDLFAWSHLTAPSHLASLAGLTNPLGTANTVLRFQGSTRIF